MNMGEYIKYLRQKKGISQSELGQRLIPSVNKTGIHKWESGVVENIRRTHIEQMAKIFDVSPCRLMCFDSDESSSSDEKIAIEYIKCHFGNEAITILELFNNLNNKGRNHVIEQLEDYNMLDKYKL